MNASRYKSILYFIAAVIGVTLCIQVYWNYKNYQASKQQFLNDVQTSLDKAVDQYYTNLATESSFEFIGKNVHITSETNTNDLNGANPKHDIKRITSNLDSMGENVTILKSHFRDSLGFDIAFSDTISENVQFVNLKDSLKGPFEALTSKIILSFSEDGLSLEKIDSLLSEELKQKNINLKYGLAASGFFEEPQVLRSELIDQATLSRTTRSPYFMRGNELKVHFSNITFPVLKRNLLGIGLSFILITAVVLCLLYLLKVIQNQKQLSEVKNDLISNITHEFKTPLATIGVALEGIQSFNSDEGSEKTKRYAEMSRKQVDKLNTMVEKLLETATLDSDRLELNLETIDLVELLERLVQREELIDSPKNITFSLEENALAFPVDIFHFENAINNILDNAIKYGGDQIEVQLIKEPQQLVIQISDNGTSLTEVQAKQVFEKFYRVPKGNTHDVKGFGIGLYYTKKIIEKHKGKISLNPKPNTNFKITLPNG